MMQIEKQREEYYKSFGTPPGVPTMKGATADPDNTGRGYNDIIGDLGDHSVPEGWIQRPKFNEKGDVPGLPIQWSKPEDPDNAQPGYGYIPTDTTNIEDIFFYHSDHLGSTSYITDAKANITQFDAYLPYGELLVDEHSSTEDMPYKFNGKELDQETGLYYYGARYLNPIASIWYGVDPLIEKYPDIGGYVYCIGNPINLMDIDGREIFLHGSEEAQNAYVKMLYESTGNKYAVENNKLTFIGFDTNFEGKKSQTLIKTIQSGIDAKETYNLNLVGDNSDDHSVFIDSYNSKNIDISDLKVLGEASTALQGAAIGHFLNEVQVGGEFSTAHEASLKTEGLIYGELVGDNTIKARKEYQLAAPKDGVQTIIFEYNSTNKFKLEQGATSTTKRTGKFIGHVEITETTVLSTGELRSVNKME